MSQERVQVKKTDQRTSEELPVVPSKADASEVQKIKEETDELLDAIDALLEENAEEFVQNYIQKGGQ
jgi:ubiquitin-like protein Pup